LAALLYYTERPTSEAIGARLYSQSKQESITADPWLSKAVYAGASRHGDGFMKAYTTENPDVTIETTSKVKRQAVAYDDSGWKTMKLPQYIENEGLNIDGVIWFRRDFNFSTNASTYVSLGPIDDSDIVYINGTQVGLTEKEYAKNRYYDIPLDVLKNGKNTIAIRVEDTGGGGGVYGEAKQMYVRSGKKTVSIAGDWKYEVETDFAESANNAFGGSSIAAVFAKNYEKEAEDETILSAADKGRIITMKTIQNEMKYDLSEFVVKAGETVTLVFENNDFMQHNLLILAQGSLEKVGAAADKLAQDLNAADSSYIPNIPEVLQATKLVNPNEKVTLTFKAPEEEGEYPYVCTFPGHWRIMQGIMKVVK